VPKVFTHCQPPVEGQSALLWQKPQNPWVQFGAYAGHWAPPEHWTQVVMTGSQIGVGTVFPNPMDPTSPTHSWLVRHPWQAPVKVLQ
jgi:hypothetical protein